MEGKEFRKETWQNRRYTKNDPGIASARELTDLSQALRPQSKDGDVVLLVLDKSKKKRNGNDRKKTIRYLSLQNDKKQDIP